MTDQTASGTPHADPASLAKASVAAAVIAALVLTLFVLPAEYGIDPTGAGRSLGLLGMANAQVPEASSGPSASLGSTALAIPDKTAIAREGAWREDSMTLSLAPHSGKEIKAHMNEGDSFIFEWSSEGGPVKVDMHGERTAAPEGEFTSYWKERQLDGGKGVFTAPFEGTHGWYWRNKSDTPVEVTVKVAGFYKDLFRPGAE